MLAIFLIIFLFIFTAAAIFIKKIKENSFKEKKVSFLLITQDCQDIIEGTILQIVRFCIYYPWCEIIVVDRYSKDDTYNILLRIAKKYSIHLIQNGPDEIKSFRIGKSMCTGKKICLIIIDENSSYKKIFAKIHNIKNELWKQDLYKTVI
jgi:glycosyltransferase involved in cell wall biosynthesis